MMRLELATAEYIGARAQQQDLAAAVPLPTGAVLVLADGLGGHESGADASRIVVETFREASLGGRFNAAETRRQALRDTVDRANARIGEGVNPAHGHRGMASTVVAAVVAQGELSWVSVGDSHLYVWRGGRLRKLNEDHSQAGLMVRSGQYHASDPEVQAVKSVLVSALTGRKLEIVDLPQKTFKVEPGDVLMLASDGLNTLDDEEIEGIVAEVRGQGAVKLSTTLLERVRSRRVERQDNTTVAIARVLEAVPVRAEPPRKAAGEAPRRPAETTAPHLDETSEARTERVMPAAAEPERLVPDQAPVAAARAAATSAATNGADAAKAAPRPSPEPARAAVPAPSAAPGVLAQPAPAQKAPEPEKTSTPARLSDAAPSVSTAPITPVPDVPQAPAAMPKAAAANEAAAVAEPPAASEQQPHRPAGGNGARVSQPRTPVATSGRTLAEAMKANLEKVSPPPPDTELPIEDAAAPSARPRRGLLGLLLLLLLLAGMAFGAVAAFKPEWLIGLVPGFGGVDGVETHRSPAAAAPEPASQVAPQPAVAPAAVPVPAPVPAVRPAPSVPEARPDAADGGRGAIAAPKGGAVTPQPVEETPKAATATEPAAVAVPAAPPVQNSVPAAAPAASDTKETAAPPAAQQNAPQAAPAQAPAADPALVEPQRPARPPAKQQKQRQPPAN